MSEIATWDEFRRALAETYEATDVSYARVGDDLMHGGKRSDAMYAMASALAEARENLDNLVNLAVRITPPEPPGRPLEEVLADIRALGFRYTLSPNDVATYLEAVRAGNDASRWHTTWIDEGGVVAAAEDELTRLRELHAQVVALVETLSYRPSGLRHFATLIPARVVCGTTEGYAVTMPQQDVTCPACMKWIREHLAGWADFGITTAHEQPTEADIEAFLTAIGAGPEEDELTARTRYADGADPDGMDVDLRPAKTYNNATDIIAGVGMVHIEDGQEGQYAVGELAREGDSKPWKVVSRKEGEAPSVVFEFVFKDEAEDCRDALNTGAFEPLVDMDPEVQVAVADKIAEEVEGEKFCPECGHPMMQGPLQSKGRTVAWWCANCHHGIEESALVRADHERETEASEGDE